MSDLPISYRSEFFRKTIHLLSVALPVGMLLVPRTTGLVALAMLTALALAFEVARGINPEVNRFFVWQFGWMMRPDEKPPLGRIRISGATWVLLSALVLLVCFPARIAAMALTVFMIGDAAAALVGRRFGRHRWSGSPKTIEGTIGFIVFGALAALFFPKPAFWLGPAAALLAGALELLPGPLNDNIQAPFITALAIAATEHFVLGLPMGFLPGLAG
ncbi:MAG: phosphatidate cytidylyltransferase [Rhodothermales bacterium]